MPPGQVEELAAILGAWDSQITASGAVMTLPAALRFDPQPECDLLTVGEDGYHQQ
jgi:hypothetical protein